ncbi:HU family DNA-binding protein [Desulfogranum marinum]|uniref:HU family DNA-binding protein n=1 Tax=Desulfogranum marinum TaxID=453220 RepID=UPI002FC751D2
MLAHSKKLYHSTKHNQEQYMNKKELVDYIADNAGLEKKQAAAALDATLKGITETLVKKDKVTLIGFGTFSTSERAERQGKNPQNGKAMTIPAKTVVKFKVGKAMGDEVNNG